VALMRMTQKAGSGLKAQLRKWTLAGANLWAPLPLMPMAHCDKKDKLLSHNQVQVSKRLRMRSHCDCNDNLLIQATNVNVLVESNNITSMHLLWTACTVSTYSSRMHMRAAEKIAVRPKSKMRQQNPTRGQRCV
jgi:hypothetical protein